MTRTLALKLASAAAFVAFTAFDPVPGVVFAPGLSTAAHAAKNLNSSRSNIYRKKVKKAVTPAARATTVKSSKSNTSD